VRNRKLAEEEEGVAEFKSTFKSLSMTTAVQRIVALDAHRGFLMVLMAIDHASYFIARIHSAEFWGSALPVYPNGYWFWTRWITHLCAPGFFFLMGIGMILFAEARRKAGWEEGRITRFFLIRGGLLILLQLFVEDPAWIFGGLTAGRNVMVIRGGGIPGGGKEGMIYLGVLFSLGGTMVFWAFMRRAWPWLIGAISLSAVLVTEFVIPGSDRAATLYSPLLRLLLIPGHTNIWEVFYPVVPWLGVTGLGLLFGQLLRKDPNRAGRVARWTGLAFLVLFVILRTMGGFGNLHGVLKGWMGFLNVTKYPPSLSFLTMTLGINLLWMGMGRPVGRYLRTRYHPLVVFGRVALFFYLLHLWVYSLLGLFFRAGSDLVTMYGVWLFGLVILYPFAYGYDRLKSDKPVSSLWRFF
jgi:uncharacterized membrane protein